MSTYTESLRTPSLSDDLCPIDTVHAVRIARDLLSTVTRDNFGTAICRENTYAARAILTLLLEAQATIHHA